jgi:hypothetical protein
MIGFQTAVQAQVVQSLSCNSSQLGLYQSFQNIGAIPASHFVPRAHLLPKDERNGDFSFGDRRKFIQNRARSFNMWSGGQRRIRLAGAIPGSVQDLSVRSTAGSHQVDSISRCQLLGLLKRLGIAPRRSRWPRMAARLIGCAEIN